MITIYFSCPPCGLVKHALQVPARIDPDVEALLPWMGMLQKHIGEEHRRVSPHCKAAAVTELAIPLAGSEFVGQQVE